MNYNDNGKNTNALYATFRFFFVEKKKLNSLMKCFYYLYLNASSCLLIFLLKRREFNFYFLDSILLQ